MKENYKDWSKAKDLDKLNLLKPLDHLNTYNNIPMKNKTAYNDFFGSKSKDPYDNELNELLKSKREKNQKFYKFIFFSSFSFGLAGSSF